MSNPKVRIEVELLPNEPIVKGDMYLSHNNIKICKRTESKFHEFRDSVGNQVYFKIKM